MYVLTNNFIGSSTILRLTNAISVDYNSRKVSEVVNCMKKHAYFFTSLL